LSKNLLFVAMATTACALFSIGCSKGGGDTNEIDSAEPMIGPSPTGPGAPGGGSGGLPPFHFDDAGATPNPAATDAGPDIQPVDVDPGPAFGARIWATDLGGRLLSFRVNAPDKVSVKLFAGLAAGEMILNVTFRPVDSVLYGVTNQSRLYTINTDSGAASVVGDGKPFDPPLLGQADGFDFNPVADKIRVHTDVDEDLRLDPKSGKVAGVDGMLAFAPNDVNFRQNPNLVATAYTNSVNPPPSSTTLYALDSTRNLLTRLPDPNSGLVETVGELGVDFDQSAGFDINRQGIAYAALHVDVETALYTIDLGSGAAKKMGAIVYPLAITSIAVEP
jgi:hypothetical protein